MYGFIFTLHLWVQTLDQTLEWQSMPVTSSSNVYFQQVKGDGQKYIYGQSYFGSWVKAWKPALDATKRRMAWKWLSSSVLRPGSSVSWLKRARMALLMSFSLFSEKRPWREWKRRCTKKLLWLLFRQMHRDWSYRKEIHSHLGLLHAALHCRICWHWIWILHLQNFHLSKGKREQAMLKKLIGCAVWPNKSVSVYLSSNAGSLAIIESRVKTRVTRALFLTIAPWRC